MPLEVQTGVPGPTGPAGGLVSLNGDATGAQTVAVAGGTDPLQLSDVGSTHTFSVKAAAKATINGLIVGSGAPVDGSHADGTYYFRTDGSLGAFIYFAALGAWSPIL